MASKESSALGMDFPSLSSDLNISATGDGAEGAAFSASSAPMIGGQQQAPTLLNLYGQLCKTINPSKYEKNIDELVSGKKEMQLDINKLN